MKNKFDYGFFYKNTKVENWESKKQFLESIGISNSVEYLMRNWAGILFASVESMQKNYTLLSGFLSKEQILQLVTKSSSFLTIWSRDATPRYSRLMKCSLVSPKSTFALLCQQPHIIMKHMTDDHEFSNLCIELER